MVKHRTLFLGSPLQIAIPKASTRWVMHRVMQFLRVLTSRRLWPWARCDGSAGLLFVAAPQNNW